MQQALTKMWVLSPYNYRFPKLILFHIINMNNKKMCISILSV